MTALIIVAILFISLLIAIPLLERSKFRLSGEQMGKLGRWVLPLMIIAIILQLIFHYTG